MVSPIISSAPQDELSDFMAAQPGTLLAAPQWSALEALDGMREKFDGFLDALSVAQKFEYVRLQQAWINAQKTLEQAIQQLTEDFEQKALASLCAALKTLTGQDIDPGVARIHTRYLQAQSRVRRAADGDAQGTIKVASLTLWEAACLNYDGLTGWSYPGRTGLADASYLDTEVNTTAAKFIALVRQLNIGGQLKTQLDQSLRANAALGTAIMGLASAEFEFALIEALRDTSASRVDQAKYQQVKQALAGALPWGAMEEMLLFIPHGVDNISWLPQQLGFIGQHMSRPPGDSLSVPHLVFSVDKVKGAFSFFPGRPGGALRHHDSHREACEEFHVAFHGFYSRGHVDWLYQVMLLRDCARLKQIAKTTPPPQGLEGLGALIYRLSRAIPTLNNVQQIGYVRNPVTKAPVVSLCDFYLSRCRGNLKELAHQTPGFMPTMIELFQTVIGEILNVLLIPVPGALKGLGRVRTFAMFVAMERALIEGGHQAMQGQPGELLQGFADLADLLVSGRLHTRLARSVQRRHQRLYHQLSQQRSVAPVAKPATSPELLERMLDGQAIAATGLDTVLEASGTSPQTLDQVWEGAAPSGSLVEAVQRFRVDKLIEWVAAAGEPSAVTPTDAVAVIAPLLMQLDAWPADTCLSINNPQGVQMRRYSKDAAQPTTAVVAITALENYQFAYATPPRITAHLAEAIAALLPQHFPQGEPALRQQLAERANALSIDLFEALTQFAGSSRALATPVRASVRRLLPDSISDGQTLPAVVSALHALHPDVSQARLLAVLREHPLSAHQQAQLLDSKLQPEALYTALRNARQAARQERIVDAVFNTRRFNRQIQDWVKEFAGHVLRGLTGQALVVSPKTPGVPYISRGERDRTIVIVDQGNGAFSAFNHQRSSPAQVQPGTQDFYSAVVSQLAEGDLHLLGWNAQRASTEFRYAVARALLRNRASDGRFYPSRREIAHYVSTANLPDATAEPDARGLYAQGADLYLFIEGHHFKVVAPQGAEPWRIQHPFLDQAYAPVLTHNGAGAWRHEWENPLTWDGQQPFYRLGPWVRALTPDAIEQIQHVSGVTPAILRRVHVRNERPPVILRETVERFTLHQRLTTHMEGMQTLEGTVAGREFLDHMLEEISPHSADTLVGRAGVSRADQVSVLESKVIINKALMERLFFKALCEKNALSSAPFAQVLQRDFPGLTAAIAEDLVSNLTAAERTSLEAGRMPLTLTPLVRWWLHYLRKARALEGVYLPAAENQDSAKLILHTLPDIDGWPKHLRFEVYERGRLIDSIGAIDARLRRVLEVLDGQYQAYNPQVDGERQPIGSRGGFLKVLLEALPAAEREVLGYTHAGGVQELTQEIAHRLEPQQALGDPLLRIGELLEVGQRPWYRLPQRLSDGRVGYPLSGVGAVGRAERGQVARLRLLFPSKTDAQALEILQGVSNSVQEWRVAIDGLFRERNALNESLERWCLLGRPENLTVQLEAATRIRRCWSKEDSTRGVPYELNLDDLALEDLPQISAYFGHVRVLSCKGNRLSAMPENFLRGFPDLRWLLFDNNRLVHLPVGLDELRNLSLLSLANNQIQPDLSDVRGLAALTELVKLDLSGNPLGTGALLKLYPLRALKVLMLRNTGLSRLPSGAVTLRQLQVFDVRDNQIRELGEHDLYIYENVHRALDLSGNDLSQDTYELLASYRRRPNYHAVDFGLSVHSPLPKPFIDRWLPPLPLSEVPLRRVAWAALSFQQMADRFFNVLWNISAFRPLTAPEHSELRGDITRRVWGLIDNALSDGRLRQMLFDSPLNYRTGGIDGWLLCINDLELQMLPVQMLAGDVQSAGPDFINFYRAQSRLASITQRVLLGFSASGNATIREICRHIFDYRMALAETLDLPMPFHQRFDVPAVSPGPFSTNRLRNLILAEEREFNWPDLLKGAEHWIEFLELKYPSHFKAALHYYDVRMTNMSRFLDRESLPEGHYVKLLDALKGPREEDRKRVIERLTQLEWASFAAS